MIISKAERTGGKGEVRGYYYENKHHFNNKYWIEMDGEKFAQIDPLTLKHSFDNGESWYSEDEIREALKCWNTPY